MNFVFQRLCLVALLSLSAATLGSAQTRATVAIAPGIGLTLPELGAGGEPAFVDAMKEASPWSAVGNLRRDVHGNVMALAYGQVAHTVIYPSGAYPTGDYTLLFDGAGTFAVATASGTIVRAAPGRLSIHITARPGYGIALALLATDPRDYARNIRLILPGFGSSKAASPFRPQFVNELRGLSALRFAGWEHPGPAGDRSWAARAKPAAFTQAGSHGVSPEYAIALANAAGVNPWFTIPVDATSEYVAAFARLVASTLDPHLRPAFEYDDEIWAPGTASNAYASLAGRALEPRADEAALAWYSLRSVQIFSIVDGAFAGLAPRPAHVLSGPLPERGSRAGLIDAQILRYANAAQHADAFAVAAEARAVPTGGMVSAATAFASAADIARAAHLALVTYQGGASETLTPSLLTASHFGAGSLLIADAVGPQALRAASALAAAAARLRLSPSTTTFTPATLPNLVAWYDASNAAAVTKSAAGNVSAWRDEAGYGDTLSVPGAHAAPVYVASGIDGKPSLAFDGKAVMAGSDLAFSKKLFNESTVFVVGNETPTTITGDMLFSGAYHERNPVWTLRPTFAKASMFAFDTEIGALAVRKVESGPTIWSAGGSVASASRDFRKNGSLVASGAGPSSVASGSYPLAVGAMYQSGTAASYFYRGQIGEIVIYDRDLTTAETTEIEGYLACKWALQKSLPAGHPYRNVCPSAGATPAPSPTPSAIPLPAPTQLSSVNGKLTLNVRAVLDPTTHDPALIYAGSETPPTLNLNPGDTLIVNLSNALPLAPAHSTYANDVNLHYHGLHVSPNAPADDSIDMVAPPGKSVRYEVPIPTTQPPGLYWYHSHAHGESERQNLAGMSGALLIAGIAKYAPAVTNMPQRLLIVRDREPAGTPLPPGNLTQLEAMRWSMAHDAGTSDGDLRGATTAQARNPYVDTDPFYRNFVRPTAVDAHCQGSESAPKTWTVNGVSQPSIGLKPGERQFWRLVNAGSDTYLDVQLDNATMQIVALDGVPLIEGTNTPSSLTVAHYVVPPASRIEFIVTGPAANKPSYLRTNCFDAGATGDAMPAAVLASIVPTASGPAARPNAQRIPPAMRPFRFHTASFIMSQTVSVKQTVFFSEQMQINGQSYDPSAPPMFYAQLGTTQDWTIVNTSTQVHTFHMHQVHFVLEAIDGVTQGREFVMDNVSVPPATASGPGTVRLRLDFTDPLIVGTFLVHCHILSHEDMGMMAKIRVGTAPPLALSAATVTFASPTAAAATITVSGGKPPYSPSGCKNVANARVSGSRVTIAPAGAGGCLLTIEDATGLIATVSVTVNAVASPVSLTPAAISFASASAPAQSVAIAGGKSPYAASGCANIAAATIGASDVAISPKVVGTCILTVADANKETASLSITINAPASGKATDTLTFHNDALRTGWNQHETALTLANVASADFARIGALGPVAGNPAFGKVWAQPLFVTSEATVDGKTHDLVVVATATNQVYAYDDETLKVVWHRSFTGSGVIPQKWTDTGCYSPGPDVGITGTPVIDRGLDRLYAVVATNENGTFHMRIHAISLRSGLEATTAAGARVGPTDITGTVALSTGGTASVDPLWNLQRPALLESAGNIYVALGSKCDFKSSVVHGWMLSYSASTLAMTGNLFDTSNANEGTGFLGAIWMSGYGPAADPQGNVYFVTGNGPYDGVNAFGMSVVKVAGTLSRARGDVSTFTPYAEAVDSEADADLGSGGVLLLPDQKGTHAHMAVAGGKCGAGAARGGTVGCQKYVLDRDDLGGRQANEAGALWHADTAGAMWGGPAYFADAAGISHIVYGDGGRGGGGIAPLSTYDVNPSPVSLTIESSQSDVGCLVCIKTGALPVVSSNGTLAGTAIVWAIQTPHSSGGAMSLYAFDALAMSKTLFHGVAGSWNMPPGASQTPGAFVSPLVAAGKVYVPVDGSVSVFGLKMKSSATTRAVQPPLEADSASQRRDVSDRVAYGTIVAIHGDVLTVALRDARELRVDASAAIAAGTFSAPLFIGKVVAVSGAYSADGTLHARTISKVGIADGSAPADR